MQIKRAACLSRYRVCSDLEANIPITPRNVTDTSRTVDGGISLAAQVGPVKAAAFMIERRIRLPVNVRVLAPDARVRILVIPARSRRGGHVTDYPMDNRTLQGLLLPLIWICKLVMESRFRFLGVLFFTGLNWGLCRVEWSCWVPGLGKGWRWDPCSYLLLGK